MGVHGISFLLLLIRNEAWARPISGWPVTAGSSGVILNPRTAHSSLRRASGFLSESARESVGLNRRFVDVKNRCVRLQAYSSFLMDLGKSALAGEPSGTEAAAVC